MTNTKKTVEKTQGAETTKSEKTTLEIIHQQKKALEQKLEFYDLFNQKVKALQRLQTHKDKITNFLDLLEQASDPSKEQPKILLKFGYREEYEITSLQWMELLLTHMAEKMEEKYTHFEKEIIALKLDL